MDELAREYHDTHDPEIPEENLSNEVGPALFYSLDSGGASSFANHGFLFRISYSDESAHGSRCAWSSFIIPLMFCGKRSSRLFKLVEIDPAVELLFLVVRGRLQNANAILEPYGPLGYACSLIG
jgi:hypothetical protein